MPYDVEVTYRCKLGGLTCQMSTSQTLGTAQEAEAVRSAIPSMPGLANATVMVKNSKLPPTIDEALDYFRKSIREYPPI